MQDTQDHFWSSCSNKEIVNEISFKQTLDYEPKFWWQQEEHKLGLSSAKLSKAYTH